MNAILDPTFIFISEEDWFDQKKQDTFLTQLLTTLEYIGTYQIGKIWWSDELEDILLAMMSEPNQHPWFSGDSKNPSIAILYYNFNHLIEIVAIDEIETTITPTLQAIDGLDLVDSYFKKLAHGLILQEQEFYFCVGIPNQLSVDKKYLFSCQCHNNYAPDLISKATDLLQYTDVVSLFFPHNFEDFDEKFKNGLELLRLQKYEEHSLIHPYEFTKQFQKSVIYRRTLREDIFLAILKRLIYNAAEAQNSDLQDEYVIKSKQHRIRVTGRPTSTRIHYSIEDNKIIFKRYYGEGEHDDGL
jgi:hypothetical protein